ncbi:partial Magnesium-transporting ATPase, P-type 1, partial [Anaerolineae bacterium]
MPTTPSAILSKGSFVAIHREKPRIRVSDAAVEAASLATEGVYTKFATRASGLTSAEAAIRLIEHGPNVLAKDQRPRLLTLLWRAVLNPLVILLAVLAGISFATGDVRAGTMMVLMIVLSVGLKLYQESKANSAAAKLKAMIAITATVMRDGQSAEIAVSRLVPGDVVQLAAGDMVPGDVRLVSAKDLFVIQSSLTGESYPVEKFEVQKPTPPGEPPPAATSLTTIAFLGT